MSKKVCLITGAGGLIGSECVRYFADKFDTIVGIDCDARAEYFGEGASVRKTIQSLYDFGNNIIIYNDDISNAYDMLNIFQDFGESIDLIIHTAAQPSHDWAASNPHRDFEVNAVGTLNLLEAYRQHCPKATFIFTSTNKVYGDRPNCGKFIEKDTRYELDVYDTGWCLGIDEKMPIDQCTHSLFGVSKASADLLTQEYGKYFNLKTCVFRGGCLTGPSHQGTELHGFLSYLVKCIKYDKPYTIYGYKGKQVRDIIHSKDVVRAFDEFYKVPKPGGVVYNLGGSRHSNVSVLEAISIIERKTGKRANVSYEESARIGDHQWYISDMTRFKSDYPNWDYTYTLEQIIDEIIQSA